MEETRPKLPSLLGLLIPAFAIGIGPGGLPAQEGNPQEVPTIEARFTRIFSSDSLNIGGAALSQTADGFLSTDSRRASATSGWSRPKAAIPFA